MGHGMANRPQLDLRIGDGLAMAEDWCPNPWRESLATDTRLAIFDGFCDASCLVRKMMAIWLEFFKWDTCDWTRTWFSAFQIWLQAPTMPVPGAEGRSMKMLWKRAVLLIFEAPTCTVEIQQHYFSVCLLMFMKLTSVPLQYPSSSSLLHFLLVMGKIPIVAQPPFSVGYINQSNPHFWICSVK